MTKNKIDRQDARVARENRFESENLAFLASWRFKPYFY